MGENQKRNMHINSVIPVFKILITGSREWTDRRTITTALNEILKTIPAQDTVVIQGGCRGADLLAKDIAKFLGMNVIEYPANWLLFGRYAGFRRNAEMVAQNPDVVLAFPIGESPGTRHCMKLARDAGIEVREFALEEPITSEE